MHFYVFLLLASNLMMDSHTPRSIQNKRGHWAGIGNLRTQYSMICIYEQAPSFAVTDPTAVGLIKSIAW
jgi:hypothetical protein